MKSEKGKVIRAKINHRPLSGTLKSLLFIFHFSFLIFHLYSCSSSPRFTKERYAEPRVSTNNSPARKPPPGKSAVAEGIASYYAHDFHGKKTANGEQYDMHAMTAAHRSFPFGTKVRVTNLENNKSIIVRVNDRGPFKLERIMDLSLGAAQALEMTKSGTAKVKLEVVEWGDGGLQ